MTRVITFLAAFALVLSASSSGVAAATSQNDIVKVVFVHYRDASAVAQQAARTSTCPDPSTCTDNRWKGNYWSGGSVTYTLNTSGLSGVSTAAATAAVSAAFAAWTAPTAGGLTVSSVSSTKACSTAGTTNNGENQVCWRNLGSGGTIAVTYIWYYRGSKEIIEADTIFNTYYSWAYTVPSPVACSTYTSCNDNVGAANTMDIRNIATHEFGHFLALFSDLYVARDAQLTMYGYGDYEEMQKDSLAKGDCLGITAAYGGSCQ